MPRALPSVATTFSARRAGGRSPSICPASVYRTPGVTRGALRVGGLGTRAAIGLFCPLIRGCSISAFARMLTDMSAWHGALRAHLVRKCQRRGRSFEDAEDLVQEACLRLLTYRKTRTIYDEKAFLARIVANLAINMYHREQILTFAPEALEEFDEQGLLVDSCAGPERMLIAEQRVREITQMLCSVSTRSCSIFVAHRLGYTYGEISSMFGVSERTVKKHVSRALVLLGLRVGGKT